MLKEKLIIEAKRTVKIFTVMFGSLFVFLLILPELSSAYWHFMNDSTVELKEWELIVPEPWAAHLHEKSFHIYRYRRFLGGGDLSRSYESIIIDLELYPQEMFENLSAKQLSLSQFDQDMSKYAADRNYSIINRREFPVAGKWAHCIEMEEDPMTHWLEVICMLPETNFRFHFVGSGEFLADFYTVLNHFEKQATQP